jgi:hypothetical protein
VDNGLGVKFALFRILLTDISTYQGSSRHLAARLLTTLQPGQARRSRRCSLGGVSANRSADGGLRTALGSVGGSIVSPHAKHFPVSMDSSVDDQIRLIEHIAWRWR